MADNILIGITDRRTSTNNSKWLITILWPFQVYRLPSSTISFGGEEEKSATARTVCAVHTTHKNLAKVRLSRNFFFKPRSAEFYDSQFRVIHTTSGKSPISTFFLHRHRSRPPYHCGQVRSCTTIIYIIYLHLWKNDCR